MEEVFLAGRLHGSGDGWATVDTLCRCVLAACAAVLLGFWVGGGASLQLLSTQLGAMPAEPFAALFLCVALACVAQTLLHRHVMVLLACLLLAAAVATTRTETPRMHKALIMCSFLLMASHLLLKEWFLHDRRTFATAAAAGILAGILVFELGPAPLPACAQLLLCSFVVGYGAIPRESGEG